MTPAVFRKHNLGWNKLRWSLGDCHQVVEIWTKSLTYLFVVCHVGFWHIFCFFVFFLIFSQFQPNHVNIFLISLKNLTFLYSLWRLHELWGQLHFWFLYQPKRLRWRFDLVRKIHTDIQNTYYSTTPYGKGLLVKGL